MKKLWKKITLLGITISSMMYSTMSLAAQQTGVDPSTFQGDTASSAASEVEAFGNTIFKASFLEISIVCAGFGIPCRTRLKSHRDCSDGNPMAKRAKKDVLARRFKLKIPNLIFF